MSCILFLIIQTYQRESWNSWVLKYCGISIHWETQSPVWHSTELFALDDPPLSRGDRLWVHTQGKRVPVLIYRRKNIILMFELSTKSSSDAYRVYFFINVNAGLLVTMVRNLFFPILHCGTGREKETVLIVLWMCKAVYSLQWLM